MPTEEVLEGVVTRTFAGASAKMDSLSIGGVGGGAMLRGLNCLNTFDASQYRYGLRYDCSNNVKSLSFWMISSLEAPHRLP